MFECGGGLYKVRKQDNMFSTSVFQRDSHLDEYASCEIDERLLQATRLELRTTLKA
jgi:hypothetical protein